MSNGENTTFYDEFANSLLPAEIPSCLAGKSGCQRDFAGQPSGGTLVDSCA